MLSDSLSIASAIIPILCCLSSCCLLPAYYPCGAYRLHGWRRVMYVTHALQVCTQLHIFVLVNCISACATCINAHSPYVMPRIWITVDNSANLYTRRRVATQVRQCYVGLEFCSTGEGMNGIRRLPILIPSYINRANRMMQ